MRAEKVLRGGGGGGGEGSKATFLGGSVLSFGETFGESSGTSARRPTVSEPRPALKLGVK